ncbi:hypothetical protein D3C72_1417750 [compost metagenome]
MWNAFFITKSLQHRHDVVRVLLLRVVHRAIRVTSAIVIDTKTATDVDVFQSCAHFHKLSIEARAFFQRRLDRLNLRNLRADMVMHQLKAIQHAFFFQNFNAFNDFNRSQTELRARTR